MTINPSNLNSNKEQDNNLHNNRMDQPFTDVQAKQIAGLLNTHADHLSMHTLKQLENSRELAVKAHSQYQSGVTVNEDGTIGQLFSWADHHRIASTGLLLGAIIAGFILMQTLSQQTEYGDAFLLGSDLPPEAFVDRGFEPLLNNTQAKL